MLPRLFISGTDRRRRELRAVLFGTLFADVGLSGDPRFMAIGERTLRHIAQDPLIQPV